MLFIMSCGLLLFLKLYFNTSWTLALILMLAVMVVYVILDGLISLGKYIILFLIAIAIVYYFIQLIQ